MPNQLNIYQSKIQKMKSYKLPSSNAGFTLIEALVSMLIIALGLLGLAGMQVRMQQAELESYQRSQALLLLYDMVDRIHVNRTTSPCFAVTTTAAGTPYLGTGGAVPAPGCSLSTGADNAMADAAIAEWDGLLEGSAETSGGTSVGAMIGARGCIAYDATSEFTPGDLAGIYTVSVAWQGIVDTAAPTINCANNLYGAETKRRVVSTTFRLAKLN